MSQSYYAILVTAQGCGGCTHYRGKGIMGEGPEFMRVSYITKILESERFELINLHFADMGARNIKEICKFRKTGNIISEEKFFKDGENMVVEKISYNYETKKFEQTKPKKTGGDWNSYVQANTTAQLANFIPHFPSFSIVKKEDWDESVKSGTSFFAFSGSGKTVILENGKMVIDTSNSAGIKTIHEMVDLVLSGEEKMEPIKYKPPIPKTEIPPPKEEKKITSIPKPVFNGKRDGNNVYYKISQI